MYIHVPLRHKKRSCAKIDGKARILRRVTVGERYGSGGERMEGTIFSFHSSPKPGRTMNIEDIRQCCDADVRTKVYGTIPGFSGKCDRLTLQDAINMQKADEYDDFIGSMEEKIEWETWKDRV